MNKKVGLALGAGGLKGFAHIGVLQVLKEHNIPVHCLSGTSAGSIFAALYGSGVNPGEMEEIALSLQPADYLDYNVAGAAKYLLSLICPRYHYDLEGIFLGDKLEQLIFTLTKGKRIRESKIPVAIVACDINTGCETVFSSQAIHKPGDALILRQTRLSEAVRASVAIPAVFNPKMVNGRKLVDGGLKSSVPIQWAHQLGAEYLIAVELGQPCYPKPVSGIAQIASRSLDILIYETTGTENENLADLILRPQVQNVDLDDVAQAASIIQAGRDAMEKQIEFVKSEIKKPIAKNYIGITAREFRL